MFHAVQIPRRRGLTMYQMTGAAQQKTLKPVLPYKQVTI